MSALFRLLVIVGALGCIAAAPEPGEALSNPSQEARARALFHEIRCMVCQNESIEESQAGLAGDLRTLVRDQIREGRSDAQVRAFLLQRYGEFVLLKPLMSWTNAALWFTPVMVLLLGGGLLALRLRHGPGVMPLTAEEEDRLAQILPRNEP